MCFLNQKIKYAATMERFVICLASAFHCQESFDFIAFKKDCLLALWAEMGFLVIHLICGIPCRRMTTFTYYEIK